MTVVKILWCALLMLLLNAGLALAGEGQSAANRAGTKTDTPVVQHQDYDLERYESEIRAYEEQDRLSMPQGKDMTLFVGSSTLRMWSDLEQRFKDFHAINRSFGGATIDEINHYARRIVLKYKPARIVFYAGTNDIAAGDSGEEVFRDFVQFVKIVHEELPATRIYFISTSAGPSRLALLKHYEEANRLIRDYARRTGQCQFVDITPVMHDRRGNLKREYFLADNLHMNKSGYEVWEPIIKDALKH